MKPLDDGKVDEQPSQEVNCPGCGISEGMRLGVWLGDVWWCSMQCRERHIELRKK